MTRRWWFRGLLVAAVCLACGCLGAMSGEAAAPEAPRVVAVVDSAGGPRLRPLDARTLKRLRGDWSRAIGKTMPALSPSGARVAFTASRDPVLVLDSSTGRVIRTYRGTRGGELLYWLGGEGTVGARPELLVSRIGFGCGSNGMCGPKFNLIDPTDKGAGAFDDGFPGEPRTALREGLVIEYHSTTPKTLVVYGHEFGQGADTHIELPRMPPNAPFRVVADVAHDRLFAISSAGLVAEIDRIGDLLRRERVRYHSVALNGRPFEAAWAGASKIALWGEDGLGTIDTRTWTTHAIAADVRHAITTPFGIAAWTDNPADGVTVYKPKGNERFRVLPGKRVKTATAVGDYLYADTDAHMRYSINLRTGKVMRTLRPDAIILVPDIVAIP